MFSFAYTICNFNHKADALAPFFATAGAAFARLAGIFLTPTIMSTRFFAPSALAFAALAACLASAHAQSGEEKKQAPQDVQALEAVTISASADASAQGLSRAWAGGQVARGARVGLLGTQDVMDTPFSATSYTKELIQDKQARSVGDVLQNDPGVRVARGFGNFQEAYFIRGFILGSDDTAYNGLYGLLPRQKISAELFERVEVLRGASAFLNGAAPGGGGIGGTINLLPKRAPNEPLSRAELRAASGGEVQGTVDVARRFGPDQSTGIRLTAAHRGGGTAIDDEKVKLSLAALGLDWRSSRTRVSADIGWQDHRLKQTRTNVSLSGVTHIPRPPEGDSNFAQPWSYSNERDIYGTLRAEHDISDSITAWAALGHRSGKEANSLANLTVRNADTGAGSTYRFDNTRRDSVTTGEVGVRGKARTGSVGHEWVASFAAFGQESKNAYGFDFSNQLPTNLYHPVFYTLPDFSSSAFFGGSLDNPRRTTRIRLSSLAIGDTMSMLDDSLRLTLGLRHQRMRHQGYAYGSALLTSDYDKSRLSPAVGLVYKPARNLSLYANYIEGLSRGDTASGTNIVNVGEMLPPYVSKQKEVGVKYELGRLGLGLAFFSTTRPRSLVDENRVFTSKGRDRHQGLEFTVFGEATRGLRLLGGLTWLDAKQTRTGSSATEGKRVIGVPRLQANLGADWDVPGVPGLALEGRAIHTGATYADAANTLRAPSWTRLDVGARYITEVAGRVVTLRLRVDNATNRRHWASVGGYPGNGYLVAAAPRSFSFSLSADF